MVRDAYRGEKQLCSTIAHSNVIDMHMVYNMSNSVFTCVCVISVPQSSEHADHEFTQLVVLVSLIREHLQKKQQEHIHPISVTSPTAGSDSLQAKNHQPLKPARLSKLERAKLALTSSFDNLRKGSVGGKTTEKRQRQFGKSLTTDDTAVPQPVIATEDRRASMDPKLWAEKRGKKLGLERSLSSKVPGVAVEGGDSSGGEEMGGGGRGRRRTGSWLQRFRSPKTVPSSSQDEESDGEIGTQQQKKTAAEGGEGEKREPSPVATSSPREGKEIKPAQKLERFESKEELPAPLPTSPLEKSYPPVPSPPPSTLNLGKFSTPTHVPARRKPEVRVRRAHTRAAFSLPPNDGTSQAYSKYRREHKR